MRADRLLSIIMLLQTRGRMTAHDLATRLEVSERTIYRDLEALGCAGIPIYTERGPGGGIELLDGYQTQLTGLNESEVQALALFLKAASPELLADLGLRKALDNALMKLQAALPPTARASAERMQHRIHLDDSPHNVGPIPWHVASAATPASRRITPLDTACLQAIQQALWQEHRLCLVYHDEYEGWQEIYVEPYGLVASGGTWHLVAAPYTDRPLCRVFHVARISTAALLPEHFERPADFDLACYWDMYSAHAYPAHDQSVVGPVSQTTMIEAWDYSYTDSETEPGQKIIPLRRHQAKTSGRAQAKKKKPIKKISVPRQRKKASSRAIKKTNFSLLREAIAGAPEKKNTVNLSIESKKKRIRSLALFCR